MSRVYLCSVFLFPILLIAQNLKGEASYSIQRATSTVNIDGVLDEAVWQSCEHGGGFYNTFPTDDQLAEDSTQFMITYDDNFIYIGFICYDLLPGKHITQTLKRDYIWPRNDNISIYLDTYNDKSNAFTFQVTPDNVQREGLVILGGDVQDDWDNKWFSEVTIGENAWYAEMAIPFKSFRYNNVPLWNLQVIRNNQKRNERSTWIYVPQQYRASDMVYSGPLKWDTPPPAAGPNITLIPYGISSAGKNFEDDEKFEFNADAGFDAKVGLTNSLNLDLTFNPDFSQVEVDEQVTNLQRFEISFPEQRQFFLENQDLFAQNGFRSSRPFFSRRIGISGSGSDRRNVPIVGGARVSGKMGKNWRIGVLDMVTNRDETEEEIAPAQNYSVAVLERQVFKRSRVSGVFVGRTNLEESYVAYDSTILATTGNLISTDGRELLPQDTLVQLSEYNYVVGFDYNLATISNRWEGNFYHHWSLDPEREDDNISWGAFLRYQTNRYNLRVFSNTIGEGYNAEVGFVPRSGINRSGGRADINFFHEGVVQRHGPSVGATFVFDREWNKLDDAFSLGYEVQFTSSANTGIELTNQSVTLTDGFDPSGSDGLELEEGELFEWTSVEFGYSSDNRKKFIYEAGASLGGFYNGDRTTVGGGFRFQLQPIFQAGVGVEYNKIDLPEPYSSSRLWLINPRFDLTLTNKVFITSFLQYNTQDQNFGQNFRFQWRFKPVSDLFIVYTDNYRTTGFGTKNRALVIKLSYWLNL